MNHKESQTLEKILQQFKKRTLLVIGDSGIDRYTEGEVENLAGSPRVPILAVSQIRDKLGLAANVSDNLHALGAKSFLISVVGKDSSAKHLGDLLKKVKVSSAHMVADPSRRTIVKERLVSGFQQLLRVDYETLGFLEDKILEQILIQFKSLIPKVDAVILQDYAKGMHSKKFFQGVFKIAQQVSGKKKIPIFVDPNSKTPLVYYQGAALLTPNKKEAEALTGVKIEDLKSLQRAASILREVASAKDVVITLGKSGMALFQGGGKQNFEWIPTYAKEVYDVSGAGDTVISIMALALSSGATLKEAAALGNLGAGVVVGKRGTATVSANELQKQIEIFQVLNNAPPTLTF